MARLRILVLAPDCNPDSICGPLISYSQADALAEIHDVTLVVRSPYEDAVRRRGAHFKGLEVIKLPALERIYSWTLRHIFKNNYNNQALTAFGYPFAVAFEWSAWRRLRAPIASGEFDAVLRLLPITAVLPSPFSYFLRNGPIPFVIGPINGGLPFPRGFSQADNQRQWISGLRKVYRFLPFARSTYRDAAAILAGSSQTYAEFASYRDKLFFLPENGVTPELCSAARRASEPGARLELIFVGSLIPCKACDLGLRAAAPLLRNNSAHFTVIGDGPERGRLQKIAEDLEIKDAVSFCGFLSHAETMQRLSQSDIMVFPSVRDFGAAVVFEALATGVVPIVADFGGPGDIVQPEFGFKFSLTNETDVVSQMERILGDLAPDRDRLERLRQVGLQHAKQCLTWQAKAQAITQITRWAMGQGAKPHFPPPKELVLENDGDGTPSGASQKSISG